MLFDQAVVCFVAIIWAAIAAVTDSAGDNSHCRCLHSNASCWPTLEEWHAFNVTIGGRLIAPKPTGRPCHDPHFDAARCLHIRENYFDSYLRADNAGSMQSENWEDDGQKTCSMNAPENTSCYQGQVPALGVQVEAIAHVEKAIKFAAQHRLRMAVKTSGHDFLGRSTAAGSFLIWMHKLKKNITIHESFARCGHPATPAVTVVGGVAWGEVYDALNSTGYILVGAMSLTVGATGGYVQGGGHSALGPSFGLAVDSVAEIEVVTADGKLHVANACQEPDLFFALRGGGGGTFGVVTSVTYKLHRSPSELVGILLTIQAPNGSSWTPETQEEILTRWSSGTVTLDSARWGGSWGFDAGLLWGAFLAPSSQAAANATITPVVQWLLLIDSTIMSTFLTFKVSTFQEWHRTIHGRAYPKTFTHYTGYRLLYGSRIIPLAEVKENPRRVAQKLLAARAATDSGSRTLAAAMVIGPGVRSGDPEKQTAVTPAWRNGIWHVITYAGWSWNATSEDKRIDRNDMKAFVESLHDAFPESGAYVNEACFDEPQWQRSFWGLSNYARLMATKLRVDPEGLFVCRRCVGSELWDETGNCRLGH